MASERSQNSFPTDNYNPTVAAKNVHYKVLNVLAFGKYVREVLRSSFIDVILNFCINNNLMHICITRFDNYMKQMSNDSQSACKLRKNVVTFIAMLTK